MKCRGSVIDRFGRCGGIDVYIDVCRCSDGSTVGGTRVGMIVAVSIIGPVGRDQHRGWLG